MSNGFLPEPTSDDSQDESFWGTQLAFKTTPTRKWGSINASYLAHCRPVTQVWVVVVLCSWGTAVSCSTKSPLFLCCSDPLGRSWGSPVPKLQQSSVVFHYPPISLPLSVFLYKPFLIDFVYIYLLCFVFQMSRWNLHLKGGGAWWWCPPTVLATSAGSSLTGEGHQLIGQPWPTCSLCLSLPTSGIHPTTQVLPVQVHVFRSM